MQFTVRYGMDSHTKNVTTAPTIGQVKDDVNLRAVLGYGDNVRATINGVEQSENTVVPDGCTVVFETRANTKAV